MREYVPFRKARLDLFQDPTSSVASVADVAGPGSIARKSEWTDDDDERAAIAEHDGEIPRSYADAFALMQRSCPAGVSQQRWHEAVSSAGFFLDAWGKTAGQLGWSMADVFGIDEMGLACKTEQIGLVWLLQSKRVVWMDSRTATLTGGMTVTRRFGGERDQLRHG